MTQNVRLVLKGATPLKMHNCRMADPLDPIARSIKAISGKTKKTDADHMEMGRIEHLGSMYHDDSVGPFIPGVNLHQCLVQGAKMHRLGEAVKRGVLVISSVMPLEYDGPRTIAELWADKTYVDRVSAKVGAARVMRTRPVFPVWGLTADVALQEGVMDVDKLSMVAEAAGLFSGLGDHRPAYGRFSVTVTPLD